MKYKVIAKEDLEARPHTWTKGLDYEVDEHSNIFTIASNEGQTNFYIELKDEVLSDFEKSGIS